MPRTPSCSRAFFTSSSTNGLTIAVTSFTGSRPPDLPSDRPVSPNSAVARLLEPGGPRVPMGHWRWRWVGVTVLGTRVVEGGRRGDRRPHSRALDRVRAAFPGTHPHHRLHRADPHLAVADLAGPRGLDNGVHNLVDSGVIRDDLNPTLGHEVHRVLRTPVNLGMPPLPAVALYLTDRHAQNPDLFEGALDVLQDERLDDRCHQLHGLISLPSWRKPCWSIRRSRLPCSCHRWRADRGRRQPD